MTKTRHRAAPTEQHRATSSHVGSESGASITRRVILLTRTDPWSETACKVAFTIFDGSLASHAGERNDPFPITVDATRGAILLSFRSHWIVPADILAASALALNFHPGPKEYPGIGCYNFALYDGSPKYGVTCHDMAAKVDSGPIVEERRFPVLTTDTVERLKLRSMVALLGLFQDICLQIAQGRALAQSNARWTRRPYTRRELEALGQVTVDMSSDEIARRIRAMTYPGFGGVTLTVAGRAFRSDSPNRPPIA